MRLSGAKPTASPVVLGLLLAVYVLSFVDRQLVSLLAEQIKADLGVSDLQLGLLTGFWFALVYTTFGIPIATLADRFNRVAIVATACLAWSAFTAACGMSATYWQLALARIGVGLGEAGGTPPSVSLMADYFPPEKRTWAMTMFMMATPIGMVIAGLIGGFVAAAYGWRMAFLVAAAPGVLLALCVLVVVKEPIRGRLDGVQNGAERQPGELRALLMDRSFVLLCGSAAATAFVGYGLLAWVPAYLVRSHGMGQAQVGAWLSWAFGFAMAAGILGSGAAVAWRAKHDVAANAYVPAVAALAAAPVMALALFAPTWPIALALFCVPTGLFMVYIAPSMAAVQALAPSTSRSVATAVFMFVLNLVGMGGGPVFVGYLSDTLAPQFGSASLRFALLALAPLFLIAALGFFTLARHLRRVSGSHHR